MGTLAKTDAKPKFDGTVKMWPLFKEAMLRRADGEGFGYCTEFLLYRPIWSSGCEACTKETCNL